ncbi:MAG: DJ-1/PfpI family protein [Alphaproteobacteria bacterium]|nr:DJ-1/PfpI family protein [Alphaproteobacteria bacterium]
MTLQIGFVLFPNVTQLDFTGPLQVLHRMPDAQTHIVAASRDAVPSDCGLGLMPTTTFADCPALDVVCAPGGFGVREAMGDAELIGFLRRQAAGARYVTSVCTGAFLLGAAGLLMGKRATTHWAYRALLPLVGATPVAARVVRDGNVFTGGGVTAGVDFAFTLMAEIAGERLARAVQLAIEYDPAPPFPGGSPASAAPDTLAAVSKRYAPIMPEFEAAVRAAYASIG